MKKLIPIFAAVLAASSAFAVRNLEGTLSGITSPSILNPITSYSDYWAIPDGKSFTVDVSWELKKNVSGDLLKAPGTLVVNEGQTLTLTSVVNRNSAEVPSFAKGTIDGALDIKMRSAVVTFSNADFTVNGSLKTNTKTSLRIKSGTLTVSDQAEKGSLILDGGIQERGVKGANPKLVLNAPWALGNSVNSKGVVSYNADVSMMINNDCGVFTIELGAPQRIRNVVFEKNKNSDLRFAITDSSARLILADIAPSNDKTRLIDSTSKQSITVENFRNNAIFFTANLTSRFADDKIKVSGTGSSASKFGYVDVVGTTAAGAKISNFKLVKGTTTDADGKSVSGWWLNSDYTVSTDLPSTTGAYKGRKTTMTFEAKSPVANAKTTYEWYCKKKGESEFAPLGKNSKSYSFTFEETMVGDQYYCEATDGTFTVKSTTTTVALETNITFREDLPAELAVVENRKGKFEVSIDSPLDKPEISYKWYWKKNGSSAFELVDGDTDTYEFTFTSDMVGDQYYCVATDGKNTKKSSVATIAQKPAIEINANLPETAETYEKSTVALSVDAVSNTGSKLSYAWYYKAKGAAEFSKISGSSRTLKVKGAMNLDGGEYKCVVSSAEFKLETAATKLTVREIPRFTVQPVKCTVFSGGNAKFEVQATGYDLQYVWQYYDAVSKSWINIDTETSNELIVSKAEFERNGMKYRCAISNGGESNITYSKAATMVVKQTAQYDEQPESTTVIIGKNAKFAVKASGASRIYYKWEYCEPKSSVWKEVSGASRASLSVSKPTKAMDGRKYRCYILNGGLSDWLVSETATLSVNEKTVLSEVSKPAYVFENSSVEVSVKARADTSIVYKWQRYENKAWVDETAEAKIAAEESVLKLNVAGSSLSAPTNFRCLVWSGNGENAPVSISKTIRITPCALTAIELTSKSVLCAFDGADASRADSLCRGKFAVKATGYGSIKYKWFFSEDNGKNWNEINGAKSAAYTTERLVGSDFSRVYKCEATNPAGTVKLDGIKVKLLKPMTNADVSKIADITCANTDSVKFVANTTYDNDGIKLTYRWYVDRNDGKGFVKVNGSKKELVVSRPNVSLSGAKYKCLVANAGNADGEFAESAAATLTVIESAVMKKGPQAVVSVSGTTSEFSVSATGSNLKYIWEIRDAEGNVVFTTETTEPTLSYEFTEALIGGTVSCSVQSRLADGTAIGTISTKTATVNVQEAVGISKIQIKEEGGYSMDVSASSAGAATFRASYKFPFSINVEATGYSPTYQWYESVDGGAFAEIRNAKSKSYKPNVSEKTWVVDGVKIARKSYFCTVSNKNGSVVSAVNTPVINVVIGEALAPVSIAGTGIVFRADDEEEYPTLHMLFQGSDGLKIFASNMDPTKTYVKSASYWYNRSSSITGYLNFSYTTVIDGKTETKEIIGALGFSDDGATTASFTDDKTIYIGTVEQIGGGVAPDKMTKDFTAVSTDGLTYKVVMRGGKNCDLTVDGKTASCTYSYLRRPQSCAIFKVNGKFSDGSKIDVEFNFCFVSETYASGIINKKSTSASGESISNTSEMAAVFAK